MFSFGEWMINGPNNPSILDVEKCAWYLSIVGVSYEKKGGKPLSLWRCAWDLPVCPPLLPNGKFVTKWFSRRDGTICNARSSIHPIRSILVLPMPMKRSRICGTIVNIYHNGITFIAFNKRPRELSIDNYKCTQDTYGSVRIHARFKKKSLFSGVMERGRGGRTIGCSFNFRNCPVIVSGCRGWVYVPTIVQDIVWRVSPKGLFYVESRAPKGLESRKTTQ